MSKSVEVSTETVRPITDTAKIKITYSFDSSNVKKKKYSFLNTIIVCLIFDILVSLFFWYRHIIFTTFTVIKRILLEL
jgi:hypothetical protein